MIEPKKQVMAHPPKPVRYWGDTILMVCYLVFSLRLLHTSSPATSPRHLLEVQLNIFTYTVIFMLSLPMALSRRFGVIMVLCFQVWIVVVSVRETFGPATVASFVSLAISFYCVCRLLGLFGPELIRKNKQRT